MRLIKAAKDSGADAIKFQAYMPWTITINHPSDDFQIKEGPWKGQRLYELYKKTQTPFEWFPSLFSYARALGITVFASVFDKSSVDMLESLHCPAYKIASMEITDLPLIAYAAKTKKPLIISTGMAKTEEIEEALTTTNTGYINTGLLHCVSGYPTQISNANLGRMRYLARRFSPIVGLSDHTVGATISIAATAMGACLIEKHGMIGPEKTEDEAFSMYPEQFRYMVSSVRGVWQAMQPPTQDIEKDMRPFRRSLYVVKDIAQGEPFTEDNVRSIRPAYGMAPKELPWVLTRIAAHDLKRGTALKKEHIAEALSQTG